MRSEPGSGNATDWDPYIDAAFVVANGVILLSTSAVGLAANVFVVLAVYNQKSLQTWNNALLVNLAVVDALRCAIDCPLLFAIVLAVHRSGRAHPLLCDAQVASFSFGCCVQLLTLACISAERYQAIAQPFKTSQRKTRIMVLIPLTWVLAILTAGVCLLFLKDSPVHVKCTGLPREALYYDTFGLFMLLPLWAACFAVIIGFYARIFLHVRSHNRKIYDKGTFPAPKKEATEKKEGAEGAKSEGETEGQSEILRAGAAPVGLGAQGESRKESAAAPPTPTGAREGGTEIKKESENIEAAGVEAAAIKEGAANKEGTVTKQGAAAREGGTNKERAVTKQGAETKEAAAAKERTTNKDGTVKKQGAASKVVIVNQKGVENKERVENKEGVENKERVENKEGIDDKDRVENKERVVSKQGAASEQGAAPRPAAVQVSDRSEEKQANNLRGAGAEAKPSNTAAAARIMSSTAESQKVSGNFSAEEAAKDRLGTDKAASETKETSAQALSEPNPGGGGGAAAAETDAAKDNMDLAGAVCMMPSKAGKERANKKKESKMAKRAGYIIVTFLLFWLPLVATILCNFIVGSTGGAQVVVVQDVEILSVSIACITSLSDPIIYAAVNPQFRMEFHRLTSRARSIFNKK